MNQFFLFLAIFFSITGFVTAKENYMDEKSETSNFDIPGQPELVACTPAEIPVDPDNPDSKWCDVFDNTFAVRIQNRSLTTINDVTLKMSIPDYMEYVCGSTEIMDEFFIKYGKKVTVKRNQIDDLDNCGFPLKDGYKISHSFSSCSDLNYVDCEDTIIIRFRAIVGRAVKKDTIIEAVAEISYSDGLTYISNEGNPLKLSLGLEECPNIVDGSPDYRRDDCGGLYYDWNRYCKTDEECWEGEYCSFGVDGEGVCIDDPSYRNDENISPDSDTDSIQDENSIINDDNNSNKTTKDSGCSCLTI